MLMRDVGRLLVMLSGGRGVSGRTFINKRRCVPSRAELSGFGAVVLLPAGRGGEGEKRRGTGCLAFEPLLAGRGGEGKRRGSPRFGDCWGVRWRLSPKLADSFLRLLMVVFLVVGIFIGVSMNKSDGYPAASSLLEVLARCAVNSSLACRGGEGRGRSGAPAGASLRWWSCCLLHNRAEHTVTMVAAVILGRKGGPSERWISVSSTSKAEALPGASCRSSSPRCCQVVRPRQGERDRRWKLKLGGEDKGLDCILCSSCRVLSEYVQGCVVIFSSFQSPVCKIFPPTVI